MLEQILDYERNLFLMLNGFHGPFENQFFWLYSGKIVWIPVIVVFLAVLFYKRKDKWTETVLMLSAIALVILFCDQFSSGFCKPFFHRFRPTHHPDFMNVVQTVFDYRGGKYGFISGHAANSFGFVMLTSLIFRDRIYTIALFCWAVINAYSRIFLGVHFISDIVAGTLAGLFFGWLVYRMYIFGYNKLIYNKLTVKKIKYRYTTYLEEHTVAIVYALILTLIVMLLVSYLYAVGSIAAITIK